MTDGHDPSRRGKTLTLVAVNVVLAVMIGLVSYAPTLYQLFCQVTGYGGTTQRTVALSEKAATDTPVTVRFDANIAPGLDWEFRPEQREVKTRIGEPTRAYYYAKNLSDQTIVGRATFNVTPAWAGPYFFKVECFCFTEERLEPGEEARMPLLFYVDEDMLKDADSKDIRTITLSYTFFEQKNLSEDEIAAARDLAGESKDQDEALTAQDEHSFSTEVRRQ